MPRRILQLIAALATLLVVAPAAHAGAPVIIPVEPSPDTWGVESTAPQTNPSVNWLPGLAEDPPIRGYAVVPGSWVYMIGDPYTNFPIVWEDVGSGIPMAGNQATNGFQFPLAGEYPYHCEPKPVNVCGLPGKERRTKIWVVGPRPILKSTLASPDNITAPVLYTFDASGSFVTDFTPHQITEYAFDFNSDGTYDQVSPDPYASASLEPGDQVVTLRVKDDTNRQAAIAVAIQVPKARPAPPAVTPVDIGSAGSNVISGEKFAKVNLKITAKKRMKVSALRKNGIVVRVSGVTKGDTVSAKVLNGKTTVASGRRKATSSAVSIRVKAGAKGRRILKKLRKKTTRLVISVTATGEVDGSFSKRVALRVTR